MQASLRGWTLFLAMVVALYTIVAGTAAAAVIGANLVNRPGIDGATGLTLLYDADNVTAGFSESGMVTTWSIYNDNGAAQSGREVTPIIWKRVGGNWVASGVGRTQTNVGSGIQTFNFDLVEGSREIGPGYSFGWKDGQKGATVNGGVVEWSDTPGAGSFRYYGAYPMGNISANPSVATYAFGGGSFSGRNRIYSGQMAYDSMQSVGDPLYDRAVPLDGSVGYVFMRNEQFADEGLVQNWEFYTNEAASNGLSITPLIVEKTGTQFTIRGIGATRQATAGGVQSFAFDLVAGSTQVGPGYYFAWRDGTATTGNTGVIEYAGNSSAYDGVRYFGSVNPAVGASLGTGTYSGRYYSVEAYAFDFSARLAEPEVPATSVLGNTLRYRTAAADGALGVFYTNFRAMPDRGVVDGVRIFDQGATTQFEMYQLRPTGSASQYTVVYQSGLITPAGITNTRPFLAFPNGPTNVQPGDIFAHYGRGLPYTENAADAYGANEWPIYYPVGSVPGVGNTITLGSGAFPQNNSYFRDYAWAVNLQSPRIKVTDITPVYQDYANYNRVVATGIGAAYQDGDPYNYHIGTAQQYVWLDFSETLSEIPEKLDLVSATLTWSGSVSNNGAPGETKLGVFASPTGKGIAAIFDTNDGTDIPDYYADNLGQLVDEVAVGPSSGVFRAEWDITSLVAQWLANPDDPLVGQLVILNDRQPFAINWSGPGPQLLVYSAVPEPGTLLLAVLGVLAGLPLASRFRRRRSSPVTT